MHVGGWPHVAERPIDLLGGHPGGRAEPGAVGGELRERILALVGHVLPAEAEVTELDGHAGWRRGRFRLCMRRNDAGGRIVAIDRHQHDVRGLDVAMHDAAGVGIRCGMGYSLRDPGGHAGGHRPRISCEPLGE